MNDTATDRAIREFKNSSPQVPDNKKPQLPSGWNFKRRSAEDMAHERMMLEEKDKIKKIEAEKLRQEMLKSEVPGLGF
jgi:hypothetical protein